MRKFSNIKKLGQKEGVSSALSAFCRFHLQGECYTSMISTQNTIAFPFCF
jgi:hypothetical protein